jgi:hypothetical protein
MTLPARLDYALKRLHAAIDQLDAVSARAGLAGEERQDLADTLAVMQDDRGRLANELDAALTRNQALEHATSEVSRRLGQAGLSLRRLVEETDG